MPPALLYTIGVVVFAVGLLLSIALHEIGHMVPAKKFGVKVTQYMVGFGPTLWSRKRGDTEYGIKAIPLGGYIRMIGMVPPAADGKRSRWPRRLATAVEDFRQVSRSEVDPQDAHREFYRLTPGKKMIVMLGGPCMNLLIFLVLTVILLTSIGVQHERTTTTVGSVEKCVVPATSSAASTGTCPASAKRTPAFGVLKQHDRFVSIDGVPVTSWHQLTSLIQPAAGRRLTIVVQRDGKQVTLHATPVRNRNYINAAQTKTAVVGFLGFAPHEHFYLQPVSITGIPGQIGSQLHVAVDALGNYPNKIHNLWDTVFEGAQRDQNGAVGVVGIGRLSGDFASSTQYTAEEKVLTLLGLLASVNLLLFFFNLLPLLPLDGGHVAGALVEAAKRGRARLQARRQPVQLGPDGRPVPRHPIFVDTAQMLPVMYAVASVLVVLTLLTLYADIVKPINPAGG
ncbi:site-2 protease family protein [Jatrophihabitans endophyticus]|uniref:M50 family metallopeptidase n=1 Tax=Jatrophihabitans endophyticus TaxID=1206085 RepID=UPI0026EDF9B6|nr:site-2 protease family protein [Jatrophihabitans endophyticus]